MFVSYNEACTLHNSDLEKDWIYAARAGFSYMELRLDKLDEYLETHTLEQLKQFISSGPMRPYALNGIYVYADFLSERDDTIRKEKLLGDIKRGCELCQALGVHDMVMVPPVYSEEEDRVYTDPWEKILEDNVRIFSYLADFTEPYGMRIGMEIVGAPRSSVRTIEQCNEILLAVNKPNLGYTIDAFNLYLYGKSNDFSSLQKTLPGKIFIAHINGGDSGELKELRQSYRTFCDRGVMDVKNYLKNLQAAGYDGPVSIEFFRKDCWERPAEEVIGEAYETTKAVMEACGVI